MIEQPQITIALAALGNEPGDVDFGTYLRALSSFRKYFSAIDSDFSGEKIDWVVKDLHHSEPTIILEPRQSEQAEEAKRVISVGVRSLNLMASGKDAPNLNNDALNAVKELLKDIGKSLSAARVNSGEFAQNIDLNFNHTFKNVKFTNEAFEEDWEGMLEEVNLHLKKKTFRLYPAVGPKYITCEFSDEKTKIVKACLERKVSVLGTAIYRPKSKFPHRISVQEILPLDEVTGDFGLSDYSNDGFGEDMKRLKNLRDGWLG